ncbi:MAG: NPCBM/NEW2 domain-containing protein [Pirellulales bacterium]|nr:NPCBM/NEW2 domain-containing protein [Pirellulales bacterium]
MSRRNDVPPEALVLLEKFCEDELSQREAERLERLVCSDPAVCRLYLKYVDLHVELSKRFRLDEPEHISDSYNANENLLALSPLPSLSTTHYPLPTRFVGGPVFSYMVATVVLCLMLLGAWAYKITHKRDYIAENSRRSTTSGAHEFVFVGRVTGMKDCRWSNEDTQTVVGASVSLNRQYALASGLLEITYSTGARVILEGPCTYKVESSAGGYLTVGKLTARVKTKGSGFGIQGSDVVKQKFPNPQPPIPNPFFVRTPTAVVTDLGTEFGVEVSENGDTTSHVFEGSIQVQIVGSAGSASGAPRVFKAGESVLVKKDKSETARFTRAATAPKFTLRMPLPDRLGVLDLLDVVAGGDGTGRTRGSGIDPSNGGRVVELSQSAPLPDGGFRPVLWNRLIDGVFVPDGKSGGVRLDSAGHEFAGFSATTAVTHGPIWARSAAVEPDEHDRYKTFWMFSIIGDWQYMRERRGLLAMHANVGLTFDLEEICNSHPSVVRPRGFRAQVGLAHENGTADVWVFVDGELKYRREGLRDRDGAESVDVTLEPENRFLTLVVTDGDEPTGDQYDWVLFGDPVLRVLVRQSEKHLGAESKKEAKGRNP